MTSSVDEQLADIEDVIVGGERRVRKGDREIEYRSLDELERIEQRVQRKKAKPRPLHSVNTSVNRGL